MVSGKNENAQANKTKMIREKRAKLFRKPSTTYQMDEMLYREPSMHSPIDYEYLRRYHHQDSCQVCRNNYHNDPGRRRVASRPTAVSPSDDRIMRIPKPREIFWQPFNNDPDPGERVFLRGRQGFDVEVFMKIEGDIGKGAFGAVKSVLVKAHEQPIERLAMKCAASGVDDLGHIEANVMLKLEHENCVLLKYYYEVKGSIRLLMEMMDEGDLYHLIHRVWDPEKGIGVYCELYAFQIFRGLAYMHSIGMTHRDIKPDNVLISRVTGMAKLTDFNCSINLNDKPEHSPRVGTKNYQAPELYLMSRFYNEKVDIWAAGVVITTMLVQRSVFLVGQVGRPVEPWPCVLQYLGTPTENDFQHLRVPPEEQANCPWVEKSRSFNHALGNAPGIHNKKKLMDLLPHIFTYKVAKRFTAYQVCQHPLFDLIKSGKLKLDNGNDLPNVFHFTESQKKLE